MNNIKKYFKKFPLDLIVILFSVIFSSWLMFSTFDYKDGNILVAGKASSDFSSTLPIIRSFSFGNNFPPQFPLFSGEPIHYHFFFYLIVGVLEKLGVGLNYALNVPSALGFCALLILIYYLALKLFKNRLVATLSVIFFLFNGSFAFLEFFKENPISQDIFKQIVNNLSFSSFGPYDGKIVSAFWNLNIYTNQRHLAAAFSISLAMIYFLTNSAFENKKIKIWVQILMGIVLGLFFYFHLAVFMMTAIVIFFLAVFYKNLRIPALIIFLIGAFISVPQYLYLKEGSKAFEPFLSYGYLAEKPVNIRSFMQYWFLNLGLHSILIPIGFILSPKNVKKIFFPFLIIFIIGNLFQFSPEMAANHKFFNYFMMIGVMLSSYALYKIWNFRLYSKPIAVLAFLFLIFSGVLDFFPIYNDGKVVISDYPNNPDVKWIMKNTPGDATFLNAQFLSDPASLAGRKIFLGWPYFAWSAGYDTNSRFIAMKSILEKSDLRDLCSALQKENIKYIEVKTTEPFNDVNANFDFFKDNLVKAYSSSDETFIIYDVVFSCK